MDPGETVIFRWLAAGDAGDVEAFDDLLHPDAVVHAPAGLTTTNLAEEKAVWQDALAAIKRGIASVDLDPVYLGRDAVIAASRHFVIAVHERMRGKGSGVQLDRHWAQTWTFQRGPLIRWERFRDKAEALEAVGLRE